MDIFSLKKVFNFSILKVWAPCSMELPRLPEISISGLITQSELLFAHNGNDWHVVTWFNCKQQDTLHRSSRYLTQIAPLNCQDEL